MKIDITTSALELAEVIKADPKVIEPDLLAHGERLIVLFESDNIPHMSPTLSEMKKEMFCMALEDLAMGGLTLKSSVIGLTFIESKINAFISPFDLMPDGEVVTSVSLRNTESVRKWREGQESELAQEDINAALYRIIVAISKMNEPGK